VNLIRNQVRAVPCQQINQRLQFLPLPRAGHRVVRSPVYGPFRFSVEATERRLMDAPLKRDDTGRYSIRAVPCQQINQRLQFLPLPRAGHRVVRIAQHQRLTG